MQPPVLTQKSVTVLRQENEAKILKFLKKRVGPAPVTSLCPKHMLKAKRLCTSQKDPLLTHAGRWYSYCKRCGRMYFSMPTIHGQELLRDNEEFRALIEQRHSLKAKPRRMKNSLNTD